jgi:heat-inducible transcriptional repressor
MKDCTERRDRIIETVVSRYLETAAPVSSADVSGRCGLRVSPATIRNMMRELEEKGYLAQPHTSAGRVPTVKCYRYYVRHLMPSFSIDENDVNAVRLAVEDVIRESDADLFLSHVASALSEVTDLIGVVVSPFFDQGVFERVEIIHLGGSRYLIVVSLGSGLVKTISITVDRVIARRKVEETARLLNTRLAGLTVSEIKNTIGARLEGESGGDRRLLDVILDRREFIFGFPADRVVYVSGLARLLAHPEFATVDQPLNLAYLYEHKGEIARAVRNVASPGEEPRFVQSTSLGPEVSIRIGGSGPWGQRPPLSLVSAVYRAENGSGTLAVIGTTRVHYPRLSAIVRYAAAMTARFFTS